MAIFVKKLGINENILTILVKIQWQKIKKTEQVKTENLNGIIKIHHN